MSEPSAREEVLPEAESSIEEASTVALSEREIRRSTLLMVLNGGLMQMAMAFVSSDMVLPAFVQTLTTSTFLIGMGGSLMRIGWAWPQVFISRMIEPLPRKMPIFLGAGAVRTLLWIGVGIVTIWIGPSPPTWFLPLFFILYALATSMMGITNVPWMDIIGKSVPSSHRARMFAIRRLVGGGLAMGAGALISWILSQSSGFGFPTNYGLLFVLSGIGTGLSISTFGAIHEPIEHVKRSREALGSYMAGGFRLIKEDANFRRLCTVQILWGFGMMGAPFYVPFAISEFGIGTAYIGIFVAILQFSSILSNLLWAYLGHRFGNRSLLIGGSYAMALSIAVPLLSPMIPETPMGFSLVPGDELTARIAFFSLTFVLSGFAMSGVFTGRMTYVLDIAPAGRRPTYTSFMNMSMLPQGFLPMLAGALVAWITYSRMFLIALLVTPVAVWMSHRLKDVDR